MSPASPAQLAAAVDLGTNSALLVVGRRAEDGGLEVLEDLCRMPRLGEGVTRRGRLAPAAVGRSLAVLAEFAARMDALGVDPERRRVVSTAVLRAARDADAFQRRVREETGLALEVLDASEEARLGWAAAVAGGAAGDTLIVDVGGGSTELAWDGGRSRLSVPVGAVVLHERFGDDLAAARAHARTAAEVFPADIAAGVGRPEVPEVIVLGGSGTNLAALELGLAHFDPGPTEGVRLSTPSAGRWADRLAALDPEQRRGLPIEPERAPILPAGLVALQAALERVGAAEFRVSGRGLRYGVLVELLAGAGPEGPAGS